MADRRIPDGIELTPYADAFYRDPYAVYRQLREIEPVHRDGQDLYSSSWTITSYDLVSTLLKDPRLSVDSRKIGMARDPRPGSPFAARAPDMMGLDEPDHGRLRRVVGKSFTPGSITRFGPRIRQIVVETITAIGAVESFDAVAAFAGPIPTIAIADWLGVDSRDHAIFKEWTNTLLLQGYVAPTPNQWRQVADADAAMRDYMARVIEDRRQAPVDDLVSHLLATDAGDDRLTTEEVIDLCVLLIGAGNFTTTDLISNALLVLLQHPATWGLLRREPDRVRDVVEEVLRLDSPSMMTRRYVLDDIDIDGITVARGSVVNLVIAAANHDPLIFDEPDAFAVTRIPNAHLSFGRGIHHCLGAPMARLVACSAIQGFMAAFPDATLKSFRRRRMMGFRGCAELVVAV